MAVAAAVPALLAVHGEIGARERSREWCGVSRGARGGFYSAGAVHDGRGSRRRPWRARGDLLLDSAAEVQGIVATWCLPGSGRVLEALA